MKVCHFFLILKKWEKQTEQKKVKACMCSGGGGGGGFLWEDFPWSYPHTLGYRCHLLCGLANGQIWHGSKPHSEPSWTCLITSLWFIHKAPCTRTLQWWFSVCSFSLTHCYWSSCSVHWLLFALKIACDCMGGKKNQMQQLKELFSGCFVLVSRAHTYTQKGQDPVTLEPATH